MTKTEKENWLTEKEAAAIIELPAAFFRQLVMTGPLKGVVNYLAYKSDRYRYNKIDIENYIFEDSFFARL
ncbi:MAG: hypothetical protein JWR61_2440 [Ferruginibacter sp.]|uniref:hypothetical protein n=1 Tax=Ferruginibacter sp. TaxID=1940288 RepID=UPI0026588DF5|nr:hypothetical protein [Ferruginibacter sp.]MDB5277485.1 hypothetical protein [Ferruginibacter sp.]